MIGTLFQTTEEGTYALLQYRWAYGIYNKTSKTFRFVLCISNKVKADMSENDNIRVIKKFEQVPALPTLMEKINEGQDCVRVKLNVCTFIYNFTSYKDLTAFVARACKLLELAGITPSKLIDRVTAIPSIEYGNAYLAKTLGVKVSMFEFEDFIKRQMKVSELIELFSSMEMPIEHDKYKFDLDTELEDWNYERIVFGMMCDVLEAKYNSIAVPLAKKQEVKTEKKKDMQSLGLWI